MVQRQSIPFPGPTLRPTPVAVPDVRRAKLQPPRLPADAVRRPALEARLEQATDAPLTLVAAGAGFGKTTLLAAWAGATARRVAWLSLDAEDADLRRFLRHLLAALRTAAPGIAPAVDDLLGGSRELEAAAAAALLGDELLDLPDETVLVLDDLHAAAGPAVAALLSALLRYPPPDLRIVATSRIGLEELGLRPPGSLRVETVGERDLRLARDEIALLLGEDARLSPAEAAARTDGWAAGVRALALAEGEATPRQVRDYLARDVLAGQPAELVAFLRDVAILERMSPELAAAVAGGGLAAEQAAALLAHAERRGLFVARLDEAGAWWRIHPLLRDVLRAEAAALGDGGAAGHARAAAWFAAQGHVDEAVGHALRAGDPAETADLVAAFITGWFERGGELPFGWIERLDPAEVRTRPALLIAQALHLVSQASTPAAVASLAEAERLLAAGERPDADVLDAEIVHARLLAGNQRGDSPGLLDRAGALLAPDSPLGWRQRAHVAAAMAAGMAIAGRGAEAAALLAPMALAEARAGGPLAGRLLVTAAAPPFLDGKLDEAMRLLRLERETRPAGEQGLRNVWSGLMQAIIALERGDPAGAEALSRQALAAAPGQYFTPKRQATDVLARALLAQGRTDEARIAVAEDRRRIELAGAGWLEPSLEAMEAEVALAAGDRRAACRWADAAASAFPIEPLRITDHPAMAQARIWLARDASGDAARAAEVLSRLRDHQAATHRAIGHLRTLPLLAAAQDAAGDRAAALATVREALARSPEPLPRRFLDAGPRALALLERLAADGSAAAVWMLEELRSGQAPARAAEAPAPSPSPLTPRQTEILEMVARMQTNKEIGAALGISTYAARDHCFRIFRRLGVGDRRTAVEVARAAGWIDGA